MTTPVLPKDIPVPKNADELAEMFGDAGRYKGILASADTLQAFVQAYANQQQGEGTDLHRLVAEETQRVFAQMLKDNGVGGEGIQRLNLDPQTRPTNMLTSHKQATAYNAKAAGTVLDKEFKNAAEYFHSAWHLNPSAETRARMEQIRNAASSVVPADGGFLVPETLRSQLLQIALEMAVVRPRATVVPMETARVPFPMIDSTTNAGSVFGGMIGFWGEESAALIESMPKFGRIVLDAKKLTGFAVTPNELLADSLISFAALIETLWPQALAFFEDAAFMSGSGVGEPLGFLGAGNSAGVAVAKESAQSADTIVVENVIKMYSRMLPSSLARGIWVCSPEAIPELFTMALSVGTGGGPVMLTNVAGPAPMTIFGRPLVVTEKAGRLGDRSDLAFVDLSYYLIGDRQVMSTASSTDYRFGNDQTAYRIIQRVDGQPWLKSAITPANGGPTLSPFVEIADRA
ncbi:phage major capsid protein [Streptosporangium sp. NBC_01755]|uniref:phage major capsid protein n=1 Tax=Streptosporangium sp. NBC_01755 TaxID=2975949 RepID=UPI002DD8053F|nr:phage major capsid protein [Streptosporangium sp. NBC_01755]WSD03249.1 phage major capsid protein [Streptosporangium sp. NBC_01755]